MSSTFVNIGDPTQPQATPATPAAPVNGVHVTERAVKRIRAAIAKEGISPD